MSLLPMLMLKTFHRLAGVQPAAPRKLISIAGGARSDFMMKRRSVLKSVGLPGPGLLVGSCSTRTTPTTTDP